MNRSGKKWIIAAVILIAAGALLLVGALAAVRFDITELSTQRFQTNTYEFNEDFDKISVDVRTAAVTFVPSEDEVCRIECFEEDTQPHSVKIQDGTLMISTVDNRKWYDNIVLSFKTPAITVYLPKEAYDSLFVVSKTGNIEIPDGFSFETVTITGTTSNITCDAFVSKDIEVNTTTGIISVGSSDAETIELSATTGKITLGSSDAETIKLSATTGTVTVNDAVCNHMTAETGTGQVRLENVIAKESIRVETGTGGVYFEECDALDISVKTGTGSVEGTLLSEKIFDVRTSTGSVSVPDSTGVGRCEITTGTGNVEISLR